jgi:hypothetical protein
LLTFKRHRYDPEALRGAENANVDEDAQKWLDLARGLDYSARLLMAVCMAIGSSGSRLPSGSLD